jgi:hypothetical protein
MLQFEEETGDVDDDTGKLALQTGQVRSIDFVALAFHL